MSDLIDRQAAIDSIEKHLRFGDELYPLTDTDKVLNHAFSIAASCVYNLPSAQPEIIYCKDCVKHNKGHGYYLDGMFIGIKDCCPLVEIRGIAQGHEFDYQYCAYAERRTDV